MTSQLGEILANPDSLISASIYQHLDRWSLRCLGSVNREMHARRMGQQLQLPDGRIWSSQWRDVCDLEGVPMECAIGDLVIRCQPFVPFRLIVKFGLFQYLNLELSSPDGWVHVPLFNEPLHREQIRYEKFVLKWIDNIRVYFEMLTPTNFCVKPSLSLHHRTSVKVIGGHTLHMAKGKIL